MTEEARISELLKPRYKVIADWPENTFSIGQILTESDVAEDWVQTEKWLHGLRKSSVIKYPHLFREMQWWEDRKPEEMPEYVKGTSCAYKGEVFKLLDKSKNWREYDNEFEIEERFLRSSNFLPATKTEYDQYIKTKQK